MLLLTVLNLAKCEVARRYTMCFGMVLGFVAGSRFRAVCEVSAA